KSHRNDPARAFTIDPATARALRDDKGRSAKLQSKKHGGPLSVAEEQEESKVRTRIAETVRAIVCPAGYGAMQAQNDRSRLRQLFFQRLLPPSLGGGPLSEDEDAEEAQLIARVAVFDETPEGRARSRINELEELEFSGGLSAAGQNELDSLR